MKSSYRTGDNKTVRVGLVGAGISRSFTPAMHEAEGRVHGLDYSYRSFDTGTKAYRDRSLLDIVQKAQASGYAGLNVTHPFKIEILQHLDSLSDNARVLGAANTIVFRDGKRIGHNTDLSGFSASFRREMGDAAKDRILLLGAGGAGAAVAFALAECGARELLIYDTSTPRAKALADKVRAHNPQTDIRNVANLDSSLFSGLSGVVNATPMGMAEYPGTAFPMNYLSAEIWVADIVYFPMETELLVKARAMGCALMHGSGMAVFQAVRAFELFTGLPASPDRLIETFNRLTAGKARQNVEKADE